MFLLPLILSITITTQHNREGGDDNKDMNSGSGGGQTLEKQGGLPPPELHLLPVGIRLS